MSCHPSSRMSDDWRGAGRGGGRWSAAAGDGAFGCCAAWRWRPYEIAALVFGFFLFWPLGLALLFLKLAQRSVGYEGDMFAFAREQAGRVQQAVNSEAGGAKSWSGPSFMRTTGNVAFDEWREGELTRLEEERRKLAEAERDFAGHIDQLRRARDREEFDSFMRARKGGGQA